MNRRRVASLGCVAVFDLSPPERDIDGVEHSGLVLDADGVITRIRLLLGPLRDRRFFGQEVVIAHLSRSPRMTIAGRAGHILGTVDYGSLGRGPVPHREVARTSIVGEAKLAE